MFSESISYVNSIGGQSVNAQQLRTARAEHNGIPILKKGSVIALRPEHS